MNRSLVVFIGPLLVLFTVGSANGPTDDDPEQRGALLALFIRTDGWNWAWKDGWGTTESYCTWHGVTCDEEHNVVSLQLSHNHLNGTLPSRWSDLSHLEWLDLHANDLIGPIPPEIGYLGELRNLSLWRIMNWMGPSRKTWVS
jgi:hypothetical protein